MTAAGASLAPLIDLYIPLLLGAGVLILMVAWVPLLLEKAPLSLPILCVGVGALVFSFDRFAPFALHPIESPFLVEKAAELIVIVSLMGAGLKIDRALNWANWRLCVRLLAIAMPLTILALTFAGQALLGVGVATALLLAASLAPTDPVLASDVQIEEPGSASDDEARFALTSEAGLNDALAFPFVHLAIAVAAGRLGRLQPGVLGAGRGGHSPRRWPRARLGRGLGTGQDHLSPACRHQIVAHR